MTSRTARGPDADAVARLLDALRLVSDESFAALARFYEPAEQDARDTAWAEVVSEAERVHRLPVIDEIRAAAIDLVGLRASTVYGWETETPFVRPRLRPEDQPRVANSIIEAAGAVLMRDRLPEDAVELLCGPVLDALGWEHA